MRIAFCSFIIPLINASSREDPRPSKRVRANVIQDIPDLDFEDVEFWDAVGNALPERRELSSFHLSESRLLDLKIATLKSMLGDQSATASFDPAMTSAMNWEILKPTMQPAWFHQLLLSFEGKLYSENPELVELVRLAASVDSENMSVSQIRESLLVWLEFCILPLREWQLEFTKSTDRPCNRLFDGSYGLAEGPLKQFLRKSLASAESKRPLSNEQRMFVMRTVAKKLYEDAELSLPELTQAVNSVNRFHISETGVAAFKRDVYRLLVQPENLHIALMHLGKSGASKDALRALVDKLYAAEGGKTGRNELAVRCVLWLKFCISPLLNGDTTSCIPSQIRVDDKPAPAMALSPVRMHDALGWLAALNH